MGYGIGIIGIIIWIAIALLACSGGRPQGTQLHRLLLSQPAVLPARPDHGLRGAGPNHDRRVRIGHCRSMTPDLAG